MPVYRNGAAVSTEAERREALIGFVYSPFRVEDFLAPVITTAKNQDVSFQVYDGTEVKAPNLISKAVNDVSVLRYLSSTLRKKLLDALGHYPSPPILLSKLTRADRFSSTR